MFVFFFSHFLSYPYKYNMWRESLNNLIFCIGWWNIITVHSLWSYHIFLLQYLESQVLSIFKLFSSFPCFLFFLNCSFIHSPMFPFLFFFQFVNVSRAFFPHFPVNASLFLSKLSFIFSPSSRLQNNSSHPLSLWLCKDVFPSWFHSRSSI